MKNVLKRMFTNLIKTIFKTLFKQKFEEKVEAKMSEIKEHLVELSIQFNHVINRSTMDEYHTVLKLFRLKLLMYDQRVLSFYSENDTKIFSNLVEPNVNNVGINDDYVFFNYGFKLDGPSDDWIWKHYKNHIAEMDDLKDKLVIFVKLLKQICTHMPICDIIECIKRHKENFPECEEMKKFKLNDEEKKVIRELILDTEL